MPRVAIFLYLLSIPYAMQTKLLALLFVTTVLSASVVVSVLPVANALTARTDFSNRHLSASWGNSPICGDHKCGPGEKTAYANQMAKLQRVGTGKIGNATNYQQAIQHLKLTSTSTTGHKVSESEHLNMGANATKSENSTKGTK
jgi:hypothetical protein